MTTDTVLTDEQKAEFVTDITDYGTAFVAPLHSIVESIEQAVLQSEQVQAWKKDAQQWQPIETAPQGQIALFFDAKAAQVRNCMFVDWVVEGKFCGDRQRTATHWMPLPPPPQHDNE